MKVLAYTIVNQNNYCNQPFHVLQLATFNLQLALWPQLAPYYRHWFQLPDGSTALHIAVKTGRKVMVKLLLAFNADPTMKNNRPCSPKLDCMHFTSISTCMNFLSQFYFLTPTDYSSQSEKEILAILKTNKKEPNL